MLKGVYSNVSGTCGLGVVYAFNTDWAEAINLDHLKQQGTGFFVAGFIPTKKCRKQYEAIAERFPIVYQSPVRRNRNSGNNFFFIIFDAR